MIMGSFDRIATETAHDHEVTRAGLPQPGTLDVPALPTHFRDGWYQPPGRIKGVDATSMLLERHGWDIHALCSAGK